MLTTLAEVRTLFRTKRLSRTAELVQEAVQYVREDTNRVTHAVTLLLESLASPEIPEVDDVADVFEFLNQVVDFISPKDATGVIEVLLAHQTLLKERFLGESSENRQRLLMARAMSISITMRLVALLRGTELYGVWALRARCLLLACVPASFDGVANKHRGRDVLPQVTRQLPLHPLTRAEEDQFEREWKAALTLRSTLGLPPTTLTLRDFLITVKVHRLLQEPAEFLAQALLDSAAERPETIEEDELEEGEENEDDEEQRATRSRQKQAERHLHSLEHVDILSQCLDDVKHLINILKIKFDTADGIHSITGGGGGGGAINHSSVNSGECVRVGESGGVGYPPPVHLCTLWRLCPLAFIEVMESGSLMLPHIASAILIMLKIHLEWPMRADETSVLTKWAEKINPQIIKKYKAVLKLIATFTQPIASANCDAARTILLHELGDLAAKYEGFRPFDLAPVEEIKVPEFQSRTQEDARLDRLRSNGIPLLEKMFTMTELDFAEYDLAARREDELFVSSAVPEGLADMPLAAKLRLRHRDYLERMEVDQDPANEIDPEERLTAKCLNQWRILRSDFLSGGSSIQPRDCIGLQAFL